VKAVALAHLAHLAFLEDFDPDAALLALVLAGIATAWIGFLWHLLEEPTQ
jgi:hypothetical protein